MAEDFDTEIAALEQQILALKQAQANAAANDAKAARIAELKAELAELEGTDPTPASVGTEPYVEVPPPGAATIVPVIPDPEPEPEEGPIKVVTPDPEPEPEAGTIKVVE